MREGEDLVREGTIRRETFHRGIAGIAAHEMGHLLGIIGHSSRTDVLMGPVFHDAPTIVDVNTLIRAYCHDKSCIPRLLIGIGVGFGKKTAVLACLVRLHHQEEALAAEGGP